VCETWSLTRREEQRLRMFKNMLLRKIFGPMMQETGGDYVIIFTVCTAHYIFG